MSNRPFLLLAMANASLSASLIAAPAVAQDYALPPLEPMPSASQSAPAVQTASAAQLPPVYRAPRAETAAQDMHPDRRHHDGDWSHGSKSDDAHHSDGHDGQPHRKLAYTPEQRAWWISECQRRMSYTYDSYEDYGRSDNGLGGAAIGGVLGGIAGNRIAGRGNRTKGTVIGAAAGAVLGAAIDKAEDRGGQRRISREIDDGGYCENYLAAYESGAFGYGHYGYGQPMIYRSMDAHHSCGCEHKHDHKHHGKTCKTIVTEKEVWEDVEVEHEVVKKVHYVKQPAKTRYVKQPTKTRYTKQPARSVKSVKSSK